jgi:hypothetical protein
MSETLKTNLALLSAAILAGVMVLGANVSIADMARFLEAIR